MATSDIINYLITRFLGENFILAISLINAITDTFGVLITSFDAIFVALMQRIYRIYLKFNISYTSRQNFTNKLSQDLAVTKINRPSCNRSFFGLLVLFQIAEHPDQYDLSQSLSQIIITSILIIIVCLLLSLFRKTWMEKLKIIFFKALINIYTKKIICFYLYFIFNIKGFFENHRRIIIPIMLTIGNLAFLMTLFFLPQSFFANPFFWGLCWFTLGITLISWDELTVYVFNFIKEHPTHLFSKTFSNYLLNKKQDLFVEKGFLSKLATLTAAGQAAIYAGTATFITGTSITFINAHYHAKEADKNRQQTSEQAERDRQYKQQDAERNRQYKQQDAERNRQHASQESQKRIDYKTKKRHEYFAEEAKKREHDKEMKKNSSWWSRK